MALKTRKWNTSKSEESWKSNEETISPKSTDVTDDEEKNVVVKHDDDQKKSNEVSSRNTRQCNAYIDEYVADIGENQRLIIVIKAGEKVTIATDDQENVYPECFRGLMQHDRFKRV